MQLSVENTMLTEVYAKRKSGTLPRGKAASPF